MKTLSLLVSILLFMVTPLESAVLVGFGSGTPLSVTDDFERADNLDLGSDWTVVTGSSALQIVSGSVTGISTIVRSEYWEPNTFAADQKACITIGVYANNLGASVRAQSGANSYYYVTGSGTNMELRKRVAGTSSLLATGAIGGTPVATDVFCVTATGTSTTTIKGYYNGVEKVTYDDTSTPFTSGQPGLYGYNSTMRITDWSAEEL